MASAAAGAAVPSQCVRQQWTPDDDIRETYSRRSVQIIDLALRGDVKGLAPFVSPSATFAVWEGDLGLGRKVGVDGAVEFATEMGATNYRYVVASAGPSSSHVCDRQKVTVWFYGLGEPRAYVATFTYLRGRLVDAVASAGSLSEGKVGPR